MLEMKYFVLKPRSKYPGDPWAHASRQAMKSFAIWISNEDKEVASELLAWVKREEERENESYIT